MNSKVVSFFLIFTQLLSPFSPAIAGSVFTSSEAQKSYLTEQKLTNAASGLGGMAGQAHLDRTIADRAVNTATGAAGDAIQGWLQQFGTAKVNLNVDRHGDWSNSSVDWLVPLWQSPENILFTQLGYRAPDGRKTLNTGVGVRTFQGNWMYGANVFLDNDLTGHNRRVGIGMEAWRDYLKLSANTYFGMTDWHQSRDFADYDERPADGWDIRAQAWLPSLPQVGGQLVYEKYHGDSVALVDKDSRQRNPSAVTAGLSYTPVPLVSFGVDHRMVSGAHDDTQFSMKFRYQFGTPWQEQVSPSAVANLRSLAGSRYDLVERNNTIVLDYCKQDLITLRLPDSLKGEGGGSLDITAQITSKYGVSDLDWRVSSVTGAGGEVVGEQGRSIRLKLPAWQSNGNNQYLVSAVARDTRGNRSDMASTLIHVNEPSALLASDSVSVVRDNAPADGTSTNEVQAKVTGAEGQPVAGQVVSFTATNGAAVTVVTGTTGADGIARATLTSTTSGPSVVTASLKNGQSGSVTVNFTDAARIAEGDLTLTRNNAPADGTSRDSVQARVTNAAGKPLAGQPVAFTATNGVTVIVETGTTGADGIARASLTSTQSGDAVVTATLTNGQKASVTATFTAFAQIAENDLVVTRNNAAANGVSTNTVEARVTSGAGNPLSGQPVSFSATNGATVTVVTGTTGSDGIARANLTSTTVGNTEVTASLTGGASRTVTATFTALTGVALRDITVLRNNALADGEDTDLVRFRVTDGQGVPLAGQTVNFQADNGATVSVSSAQTSADGTVTVTLTSSTVGASTVTATLSDGASATARVNFIPVATIDSLTVTADNAIADGSATNAVQLRVVNGRGEAVQGQQVTFAASNGATVTTATATTNASGLATTTLTSRTAGASTVTATLSDGSSATVTVNFITAAQVDEFVVTANNAVADGTATNAVQLKVVNGRGEAVQGQQVTFAASNGATVTTSSATTDTSGLATTTLTSTRVGDSTVTATLSDGSSATVIVTFTQPYAEFAGMIAQGMNYNMDSGFPSTGFDGAQFEIQLPSGLSLTDYTWNSSVSWLSFQSVSGKQFVTMKGTADGDTAVITAMPKSGTGTAYRFTFSPKRWFVWNEIHDANLPEYNRRWCSSRGYQTASHQALTSAAPFRQSGPRGVGTLWGEWGDITRYNTTPLAVSSNTYMADETDSTTQYSVRLTTGWVYDVASSVSTIAVCSKNL